MPKWTHIYSDTKFGNIEIGALTSYPRDYTFDFLNFSYTHISKEHYLLLRKAQGWNNHVIHNKILAVVDIIDGKDKWDIERRALTAIYQHDTSYFIVTITPNWDNYETVDL